MSKRYDHFVVDLRRGLYVRPRRGSPLSTGEILVDLGDSGKVAQLDPETTVEAISTTDTDFWWKDVGTWSYVRERLVGRSAVLLVSLEIRLTPGEEVIVGLDLSPVSRYEREEVL